MRKNLILITLFALSSLSSIASQASKDTLQSNTQDSALYLNAASDSKPREISLGLPTNSLSAVQIFEDGLPVSYYIYQLFPFKSWHGGVSARSNGSMNPMEAAMRFGEVNTYVDSYNKLGSDKFEGTINYTIGTFGQHKLDINIAGPIARGWQYSISTYQNFDPGSDRQRISVLKDRHQFYKGVLSKNFSDGSGYMSFVYQHVDYVTLIDANGPFIFVGDGSVKPYDDFDLGTDCYVPELFSFDYIDMRTGEKRQAEYKDIDHTNHYAFTMEKSFANGALLKVRSRLKTGTSNRGAGTLAGIQTVGPDDGYTYADGSIFSGALQRRSIVYHDAFEHSWINNAELLFNSGRHSFRAGMDYRFDHSGDTAATLSIASEVTKDPQPLYLNGEISTNINTSGEFYDGYENKAALYFKDEWSIKPGISLDAFARAEFQTQRGDAANNIDGDTSNSRVPGFNLTMGKITPIHENFLNGAVGLDFNCRIVGGLSFKAEGVFTRIHSNLFDYAGYSYAPTDPTDTRFAQAGLSYKNSWINLVSQLVYISQTNYHTRSYFQHTLEKPAGGFPVGYIESIAIPVNYGVESIGWTTDAMINPFPGFSLHAAFTIRDPQYKNFIFQPTFSDGVTETYDFSGNNVTGLHKMELTLDPSYTSGDWRLWLTARYISKTYINKTNSLYFNGRWETFGGVDYQLNDKCKLSLNVINILNQKGASGSISSADLVEDASEYKNYLMAGKFIRPFTIELGVNINL